MRFHSYTQNSRFNTNISWCKQWWKMLFILMYAIYFSLTIWFLCDFVSWNVYPFNHNTCSLLGHNIPACKISFKEMRLELKINSIYEHGNWMYIHCIYIYRLILQFTLLLTPMVSHRGRELVNIHNTLHQPWNPHSHNHYMYLGVAR